MSRPVVLCVDDEKIVLDGLKEQLRRRAGGEFSIESAESAEEALEILAELAEDGVDVPVIVSDHIMPGMRGADLLVAVHAAHPRTLKILLTGQADADAVGLALNEADLYRYIAKPWAEEDLVLTVREAIRRFYTDRKLEQQNADLTRLNRELRRALREVKSLRDRLAADNEYLRDEIASSAGVRQIVGHSAVLRTLLDQIAMVAVTDASVLILGESGTGKELIARAVHGSSKRADRPLVKVNCAALPANLIESELFGHEKGAFTGAAARRIGRFELADGGTIFLDEVGEMPIELQAKLLRVLQEGEFVRLGGGKTLTTDVRVIAATNQDLRNAVAEGRFREDLYYRLAVFPLSSPPLRDRPEDIAPLTRHFLARYAPKMGKPGLQITQGTLDRLAAYAWPGNVRELENIVARAVILSTGHTLEVPRLSQDPSAPQTGAPQTLREAERALIVEALEACSGVVGGRNGAARRLDVPASTLRDRIRRYGL